MSWMWTVFYSLTILMGTCAGKYPTPTPQQVGKHPSSYSNQRILRVHGSNQANHLHGHHKHVRNRPAYVNSPTKGFTNEEFPGSKHQPSFFSGPSTNHIKHLSRPPPHVVHKLPSYGTAFPYKFTNSFHTTINKPPSRKPTATLKRPASVVKQTAQVAYVTQVTPIPQVSTKTTASTSASYHSPKYASYPSFSSSPVGPIISSNGNNGPIREVPAPDLGPKPSGVKLSINSLHHFPQSVDSSVFTTFKNTDADYSSLLKDATLSSALKGADYSSLVNAPVYNGLIKDASFNAVLKGVDYSSGVAGQHSLGTLVKDADYSSLLSGHQAYKTAIKSGDFNTVTKGTTGLDLSAYVKDSLGGSSSFGGDLSGLGVTSEGGKDLLQDAIKSEKHSSSYEVTEQFPLNDQVINGHDGTKLYYAPDPDPSLPVYKVPPTKDPHSTPSNGQNFNGVYIPQLHGYSYIQDGQAVGQQVATLTAQELYQLMNGYPTVLSQPLVTYVGQSHPGSTFVTGSGQPYYQHGNSVDGRGSVSSSSSISSSSSSSSSSGGTSSVTSDSIGTGVPDEREIAYYLQHPQIHNLLHNTQNGQDTVHSSSTFYNQLQQTVYSPQNRYQSYLQSYLQPTTSYGNGNTQSGSPQTFDNDSSDNEYEPEASESRSSTTVVRHAAEGTKGAASDKDLPDDSKSNDLNFELNNDEITTEDVHEVYEFKNMPEVPFYSSLPSEQAAKTLAGLQAAGSIANNFLNQGKLRADQAPEEDLVDELELEKDGEKSDEGRQFGNYQMSGFKKLDDNVDDVLIDEKEKEEVTGQGGRSAESSSVLAEEPASLTTTSKSYSVSKVRGDESTARSQVSHSRKHDLSNLEFKADPSNEIFGKRLRPKRGS